MSAAICSVSPLSQHLKFQAFRPKRPITMIPASRPRCGNPVKYGRWDSNAEEMGQSDRFGFNPWEEKGRLRSGRKKRRWWSDELEDDEEEMTIAEEVIDSIWILKVFSSYGWALPFVLLSLLAATGPKAFLMTMLLPLGQSVVTFAFNRLSGKKRTKPIVQSRKRRRRKRPLNAESNNMRMNEEGRRGQSWASRNGNLEDQSWVDDGKFSTDGGNVSTSFGGWEELDGIRFQDKSSGDFGRPSLKTDDDSRKLRSEEEAPLLLRVLVALFPFLGYWTKIF